MNKDEFRENGYAFVDWIADYMEEIEKYPVKAKVEPGEIKRKLPGSPPEKGEEFEEIFRDFKEIIVPGMTHWQHPGWFAYFPANNSPESILAELLTAGMGAQCMVWATSPAATELEEVVTEWLRQLMDLPGDWVGVIQDTASTATLCALLTAREWASDFQVNERGMDKNFTVYVSGEAHSSAEKGMKIAGFGRENIRYIETDDKFAMKPEELERAIIEDMDKGFRPTVVIATLGTTSSGAFDPVEEIGKICKRHKIWLHVDAAHAGPAAMLQEKSHLFRGLENVDSFVFNPHKWLLTNFDCSVYYVKEPDLLTRTMSIDPAYLKTTHDQEVKNFRDWGIQLGRRFRALKLWFVLRSYGAKGLKEFLREHIRLGELFQSIIEETKDFELMAPAELGLICFRFNNGKMEREELDRFNRELMERINSGGEIFLTHTVLREEFVLRLAIGQRTTREKHVQRAWDIILQEAKNLKKQFS